MSVQIVAEVASNHGGKIALALEFIQRFAGAGADIIKFQLTRVKHLSPDDPQYQWFTKVELHPLAVDAIIEGCAAASVEPLFTLNNAADVPELKSRGLRSVKVGSGESLDKKLAHAICEWQPERVYISTGLQRMHERYSKDFGEEQLLRLACITRYPAPSGLAAVVYRSEPTFRGWSDHAVGLQECEAAIIVGARVIEKHVWLPNQARPISSWEASARDIAELRRFADDNARERFVGRWQYA